MIIFNCYKMKYLVTCLCLLACGALAAQIPEPDTLLPPEPTDIAPMDTILLDSTVHVPLILEEQEYIPIGETPELIADRLSCIEKKIPLTYNKTVHGFINYFTIRNRDYTRTMQQRQDLYFPLFEEYLAKYNLPDELKYLSIIESGLNPKAVSRARAVGLWQFMSATGRYFGLQSDWYIDDRMDPERSTEAACKYLSQLHQIFGNWELALAAYNSGPGTVRKAVRKSGYKKTFWEVYSYLPRETRSYVPQFIAITYAMNYTEQHNLVEHAREPVIAFDTLAVKQFVHFETLAKLTGTNLEDIQKLNPSVLKNVIPDNGKRYIIKIPEHAKTALELNRKSILDSASRISKEEMEKIAQRYPGNTYGRDAVYYKVKSGDVLGSIALRHGVRVEDLKAWNNLSGTVIRAGQVLTVWAPASKQVAAAKTTQAAAVVLLPADTKTYTVQPGDTLWDISRKVPGLTIEKIKTLNNLKSNTLKPGQKLILG